MSFKKRTSTEVLENEVLRGIFGPKTEEVTAQRRKLYNDELFTIQAC
jgi:hypothetical protein